MAVERALAGGLPADYRSFLIENNGGTPVPDVFLLKNGAPGSCIHYFFQLRGGLPVCRFSCALKTFSKRIPPGLLPIARDPGGNLIAIGLLGGAYEGQVLFWDHELEAEEDEPPTTLNLFPIAESFTAFLDGLHAPPR